MQKDNYKKDFKKDNYKKDFKKRPFEKRHTRAKPGTLEKALKYLKRQMKDSDVLFKYKEKAYYEKPSQKRKVKMERARAMQHKYDALQKRLHNKNTCWLVMTKNGAM